MPQTDRRRKDGRWTTDEFRCHELCWHSQGELKIKCMDLVSPQQPGSRVGDSPDSGWSRDCISVPRLCHSWHLPQNSNSTQPGRSLQRRRQQLEPISWCHVFSSASSWPWALPYNSPTHMSGSTARHTSENLPIQESYTCYWRLQDDFTYIKSPVHPSDNFRGQCLRIF